MDSELVLFEKTDHVATITLNQPTTLNALSYDMLVRLRALVNEVASDGDVRAFFQKRTPEFKGR